MNIFIPQDTSAKSMGADAVAATIAQTYPAATVIRNGSHGCAWLEPLVEVEINSERHAFANMDVASVAALFNGDVLDTKHDKYVGKTLELEYWQHQNRQIFKRCGWIDPLNFDAWRQLGGGAGIAKALQQTPQAIIDEVKVSGLRGRGGAGFPTGIKWQTVLDAQATQKYIVCNADEGDSGTFADRMLMEGDPLTLIEGMAIAGIATQATQGYIYIRSEYPLAIKIFQQGVDLARQHGLLGEYDDTHSFDITVRSGAGAYICGEETSLLESLEGKAGTIRFKPPIPAMQGLFGMPTVINNVLTCAAIPAIISAGGAAYAKLGTGRSLGTLAVQLAGNIAQGGLYEVDFGISLATMINDIGKGTYTGKSVRAVQVGGPLGAYLPAEKLDLAMDYEVFAEQGFMLGHGGVVVFDETVDMRAQARFAMQFCADESCGKCTPCRIGSTRGVELIDAYKVEKKPQHIEVLRELCDTMMNTSLCAMGGLTPMPVLSALDAFAEDFEK